MRAAFFMSIGFVSLWKPNRFYYEIDPKTLAYGSCRNGAGLYLAGHRCG